MTFDFKFYGSLRRERAEAMKEIIAEEVEKESWKDAIKEIDDLRGQFIGGHTILWDHSITFKKIIHPIYNAHGDVVRQNPEMRVNCSCGWSMDDCLSKVVEEVTEKVTNYFGVPGVPEKTIIKKEVNKTKLEELIYSHLPVQPPEFTEAEYVSFSMEWIENMGSTQPKYTEKLLRVIKQFGGVLHLEFDTRTYILIDDRMSDEAIGIIKDLLEGHPIGTKKVRVLKNG